MMRIRRFTRLTAGLVIVGAATCALAETKLYLGEYKFNDPKLYVMDPGGANVQELTGVIPIEDWLVVGLQIDPDAGKIYWTHGSFNSGRIRRANLDGSGMETLQSNLTNPRGLALDLAGGKMYWSDTQDNRMYRSNLDGTMMEPVIDTGHQLGRPTLDLVNGKLYFGNYGTGEILRANLDGSDPETIITDVFTPVAIALDLDAGKIYWADSNTSFVSNHIARANLDGSEREVLYEGEPTSSGFTGIGLDLTSSKLYWSDEITDIEKGMWEANLDGTDAERIFESPSGWNAGAMTVVITGDDCAADLTGDDVVNVFDLLELLDVWGPCPGCPADLTGDDVVNVFDLLELLGVWGPCS
jgi:hypothetical protein